MSNFMIRTQIELQTLSRAVAAGVAGRVEPVRREDGQDLVEYRGLLILVAASPDGRSYAREAQDFLQRAVAERLPMKVAPDGTIRADDPSTNTFGA